MRRVMGLFIAALIASATLGAASVYAGEKTSSGTSNGVTSHATLYYNGLMCGGNNKWQITKFSRYWTRTRLDRKVKIAHAKVAEWGVRKCDGSQVLLTKDAPVSEPFVAGIQQYTSGTTSMFFDWPYAGSPAFESLFQVGAMMHSHVTTINDETQVGTICDIMQIWGSIGCH